MAPSGSGVSGCGMKFKKAFKPKVVYPYHYRGQKPEEFAAALKGQPIDVRLRNWYPAAPPAK